MSNNRLKTTLLAVTLLLGVLLTLTGCAVDEAASAPDINNSTPSSPNSSPSEPNPSDPNPSDPNPNDPNPNDPSPNDPNPNDPNPSGPDVIAEGVAYKPFASGHDDKFSLGDFDSPYLVRVDDDSFTTAGSQIILNNVTNEITKTYYQSSTYLGIASLGFSDYANFISTNATLTIKVSLVASDGSVIADGAVARDLMVTGATNLYTWQDLQGMKHDLAGKYVLKNGITFPTRGSEGLAREGFDPVGDINPGFTGSFAGGGYGITNLSIDRPGRDRVGIWGNVNGATSVIENFVLDHGGIRGANDVGGVVGWLSSGMVSNVGVVSNQNSNVTGADNVGGLVGDNRGTVVGYVRGAVSGNNNVGGLVGQNNGTGTVIGYATGAVSGRNIKVGGLVGQNSGTAVGYATGRVTGGGAVGGLVGTNTGGTITGYWDIGSTGEATSSGGVGISAIANVRFFSELNRYWIEGTNTEVFNNNSTFLMHFTPPGRAGAWPKLNGVD